MPSVVTTLKMGGTSAVLSRSYNTTPAPQVMRVSAIQITKELLRTKGVTGLYRGLGATLMRFDQFWWFLLLRSIFSHWPLEHAFLLLFFQGHPILCCVLSSFCTSAPTWPTFFWRPICAFLLVLYVWLLGWMHCCCVCQPLWWWVTQSVQVTCQCLEDWELNIILTEYLVQWWKQGYNQSKKERMRKPIMEWWTVSGKLLIKHAFPSPGFTWKVLVTC